MSGWYPVMLNIDGKTCVVIGGGAVAERKVGGLLEAGARVRLVSPTVVPALGRLAAEGLLEWKQRAAEAADVEGAALAFVATDDPAVNRRMAAAAKAAGVPVNAADEGEGGDFMVPAVLRRGDFVLTASTTGAGPAFASRVIHELGERYGEEYAGYAETLRDIRGVVKRSVGDPEERRRLLAAAADADALAEWRAAERDGAPRRCLDALRSRAGIRPDEKKR